MTKAVLAKFKRYPELKTLLLETGSKQIVMHDATDAFWGDGSDGKGLNKLGKLNV